MITSQRKTSLVIIYIGLLLLVMLFVNLQGVIKKSITYDEYAFYDYGRQILFNGTTSRSSHKYNSKMTISALNLLPEFISKTITWPPLKAIINDHLDSPSYRYRYIYLARFVTVLFSLLLATVVYFWAKDLYGQRAGLISLTIYAFSPNILAHSKLITTDLYAACFIFIAVYTFWRYLKSPTTSNLLLSALTLGLAQLAKYTAVHLFPIFLVIGVVTQWQTIREVVRNKELQKTCNMALRGLAVSLVFIVATIAIINIGFLFENTFVRFKEYPVKSEFFETFKPVLDDIRVPVPFPYLQGLDWVKYDDQMGKYANLYLIGELQSVDKTGWWYYYIVAFLLKTPLGLLGLLCLCGLVAVDKKDKGLADNSGGLFLPLFQPFLPHAGGAAVYTTDISVLICLSGEGGTFPRWDDRNGSWDDGSRTCNVIVIISSALFIVF
jgi:hypothetical protein